MRIGITEKKISFLIKKAMVDKMAINMMCMNSKCKYYWEDNCTRNINEERIEINRIGICDTFEEGVSDWYKESEGEEYGKA